MHAHERHVFTNEFDDLCIVISLLLAKPCAAVLVTFSESDLVLREERVPIFPDDPQQWTADSGFPWITKAGE